MEVNAMTEKKIWYLAWPDRVEPIEWEDYMTKHREDAGRFHNSRGPFPDADMAEEFRWQDSVPRYWECGLTVWATHCPGCGRYAKMLAGDDSGGGWYWQVTDCKKCGILDSRVLEGRL